MARRLPVVSLLSLLVAGSGTFAACQKDDEQPPMQLEGLYEAQSTIKAGPLQLYTSGGIITTPALIAAYRKRYPFASYGFLRRDSTFRPDEKLTLLFRANNRVTLTSSSGGNTQVEELEISSRATQQCVLAGLDSISITSSGQTAGYCNTVASKIEEFVPAQRCRALAPGSGGAMQRCRLRPLRVVTLQNGQPVMPLLNWYVTVNRPGWFCGLGSIHNWNTISPALTASLAPGDTVLIQRNEIWLRKI